MLTSNNNVVTIRVDGGVANGEISDIKFTG